MPYKRVTKVLKVLFRQPINQGILLNTIEISCDYVESTEDWIKKRILHSSIINFEETGIYLNNKRILLYSSSTEKFIYYLHHSKQGKCAIDEADIVTLYIGILSI